jgi:hypothetical protein
MRVLVNSSTVIKSPTFTGSDGEAVNLVSGVPTVSVTRDDGTVLAAPTAGAGIVGVYPVTLTAATHTTRLDWLTVTWTGTTTAGVQVLSQIVEVVGGVYVTVGELRAMPALSDATKFPADVLNAKVEEFERDIAERYCGTAMVPRYQRDNLVGNGRTSILLSKTNVRTSTASLYYLAGASVDTAGNSTAFTTTNWAPAASGVLTTDGDVFTQTANGEQNLVFRYTHGLDRPPQSIVAACKMWVRNQVLQDANSGSRDVMKEVNETGVLVQYSTPDWDAGRPTGMLDVDRSLNAFGRHAPAVA